MLPRTENRSYIYALITCANICLAKLLELHNGRVAIEIMERRVTLRDSHMIALLVTSAKREEMREGSQVIIVVAVILTIVRPFPKTQSTRARSIT